MQQVVNAMLSVQDASNHSVRSVTQLSDAVAELNILAVRLKALVEQSANAESAEVSVPTIATERSASACGEQMRRPVIRSLILSSTAVSLLIGGTAVLWQQSERFRFTQGASSVAANTWPRLSKLARPADLPCLLVFVHEECPCARATFVELRKVLASVGKASWGWSIRPLQLEVAFHRITAKTARQYYARGKPEIEFVDPAEAESIRCHHIRLCCSFESKRQPPFHGGITSGRGHEGDNVAEARLSLRLIGELARVESSTYGCSLDDLITFAG